MLTSNPNHKLRGNDVPDNLIRVSPSILKWHNGRKERDACTEYQGKVHNITPYLPFHPGAEAELMKGAGRDASKLFMEVHPWVNWDGMLAECLIMQEPSTMMLLITLFGNESRKARWTRNTYLPRKCQPTD